MFPFGAGDLEDFGDDFAQVAGEMSFVDVTGGAAAQSDGSNLIGAIRGHQDDREDRMVFFELADQMKAIDVGHLQIGQDQIGDVIGDGGEGVGAVGGVGDANVGEFFEKARDQV